MFFKLRKSAQRLCWLVKLYVPEEFVTCSHFSQDLSWLPIGLHMYIAKYAFYSFQSETFFLHQYLLYSGLSLSFMFHLQSLQN